MTRAFSRSSASARYGSQIDHASIEPFANAAVASEGASGVGTMSLQERPVFSSAATSRLCALDPLPNATRLPLRSAIVLIGEYAGTMMALVGPPCFPAGGWWT